MDVIQGLLESIALGAAGHVGAGLYHYVEGWFRQFARDRKAEEIRGFLRDLGATSPNRIRQLIQNAAPDALNTPPARREELIAMLLNFARGARMVTSQGTAVTAWA